MEIQERKLHLTKKTVEEYMSQWQFSLPIEIGNLFTYKMATGTARFDTYQLEFDKLKLIVEDILGNNTSDIIKSVGVIMGVKKLAPEALDQFVPILEIALNQPYEGKLFYYFPLDGIRLKIEDSVRSFLFDNSGQLSPRVAELFILKWLSLSNVEVINAFNGLAAASVQVNSAEDETGTIMFSAQKLSRVVKYTFDAIETAAIIRDLQQGYATAAPQTKLFIHLGAGLVVQDFHPFNFRPIINVTFEREVIPGGALETVVNYYDTSKPCPPFCPSTALLKP